MEDHCTAKRPLVILTGPTAVGKTDLSIRLAKALELGRSAAGVLTMAPRYENTATVLDMTGALEGVPHFHLAMDNDWDEGAWSRLNSFLYYLK